MTHTLWTLVSVDTGCTTVTPIKVAACIVHFIIAVSVWDQLKWTITGIMWGAYTINTKSCVDIRSTTITSIIVAFCSICKIIAITVTYIARDFTALKIYTKLGMFQTILWKQIINLHSIASSTEQEQKGPGEGVLVIFCPKHSHSEQYAALISGPQQSPPSKPQPAVFVSSSHQPSPLQLGFELSQAGIQNQTASNSTLMLCSGSAYLIAGKSNKNIFIQ